VLRASMGDAWSRHSEGHVGILRIGQDEVLGRLWRRMDALEFQIKALARLLHGGGRRNLLQILDEYQAIEPCITTDHTEYTDLGEEIRRSEVISGVFHNRPQSCRFNHRPD